jgi:hypothetical protein
MFIPEWVLWIVFILSIFGSSLYVVARTNGHWDIITPIISVGIIICGVIFALGFVLGRVIA